MACRIRFLLFALTSATLAACANGQSVMNPLGDRYTELSQKVQNAPKAPYGVPPTPAQAQQIRDACSVDWANLERSHLALAQIGYIEHTPIPSANDLVAQCYLDHGMPITGLPR
jgi:hypothetical protein